MTVKELKNILGKMDDESNVYICVREPAGWICPDGAVVEIKTVTYGMDWHNGEVLIVPKTSLDIHDVDAWNKEE